jgi:hypothetical protein
MRKLVLTLLVCLLAVPAVGSAAPMRGAGDGTLSVDSGRGKVTIEARGGVIGRFERGLVTIQDLTPDDQFVPLVFGEERATPLSTGAVVYSGSAVRFRLVGGRFKMFVTGSGIDLSAVGNGFVTLEADERAVNPGTFSLDGEDCAQPKVRCRQLPAVERRFRLGLVDSGALPQR